MKTTQARPLVAVFSALMLVACSDGNGNGTPMTDGGADGATGDSAGDPMPGDPGVGDPGVGDPGVGDPGVGDPGAGDPGIGDPGAGDSMTPLTCSSCHGSANNAAPPADISGSTQTTDRGVGAHQSHLATSAWHRDVLCDDCHIEPTQLDSVGHIDTALPAELTWGSVAAADGVVTDWDGDLCTVYCHGPTLHPGGSNTQPSWTLVDGSQSACGTCHGLPPGPPHIVIVGNCDLCHPTVDSNLNFIEPDRHIDGIVDRIGGSSSDCLSCHGSSTQGTRRAVLADFGRPSHHVGDGGAMGGTLTNFDCVVCHGEGTINGGNVETVPALHGGDGGTTTVDLKDSDDTTTTYAYDKSAMPVAADDWHSGDATWRSETSTHLDPFCLSCHDADGATQSFAEDGGTAGNPFADGAVSNETDQADRGAVVDIASMVVGAPPPEGQFARHAIRGQSTSLYGSQQIGNSFWNQTRFAWDDTSVMGCADCHTVDGANGSNGNAHGSSSEYLLKDASLGASEGIYDTGGGVYSYVCYACHAVSAYTVAGGHAPNNGDFADGVSASGGARLDTPSAGRGSSLFGIACTNCHGGTGFGAIHGTSESFGIGIDGAAGTRDAYRFSNGASLRFYDPGAWDGANSTCYTLANSDTFGGCTQHGNGSRGHTRAVTRPLSY